MAGERAIPRLAALLLVASGAAALVYQVLWIRQLGLILGVDVHAVAIGVSAFVGGMGLGSWYLGRLIERLGHALRMYAFIELGIGASALATTILLGEGAAAFAWLEARFGAAAWLVPMLLVAAPAALMGGTLPVLVRALAPAQDQVGGAGGGLYAANTLGAIAGVLLAPYVLIPLLGIRGAAFAAAALNGLAALGAWALARLHPDVGRAREQGRPRDGWSPALVMYAIAGALALGYEVVWSQALVPFMSTRSFAFAVMLATYLLGLAVGSAMAARFADRVRSPWAVFGLLVGAAGVVALLSVALLGRWLIVVQTLVESGVLAIGGSALAGMSARFAVAAGWMVLVPTLLLGAAFPFALRLAVDARHAARDVGRVIALNTAGGIAGTLLAGFVLLPALGLVRTLAALALAAMALGAFAMLRAPAQIGWRMTTAALAAMVLAAAVFTPPSRLAQLLPGARGGALAFYEESAGGTVAVVESRGFHRLYIQGVSNSGDAMPSLRYMRLQALLPLAIHAGEPRSALVIGFGTGITAGALLTYPGLERRVAAELLPAVVDASAKFQGNLSAATDPRIEVRLRDGRRELLGSDEHYDLITLEPPPPSALGVANLYSSDFYALAASRLGQRGLLAQWLPLPTQNEEDTRALIRSFIDAFPHATLWTTELHEMLLVGSMDPIELDVPRISARLAQPQVARALREVGISSSAGLLATWVTDRAGLEQYSRDVSPVTDDQPGIEYSAWVRPNELLRTLPGLIGLTTNPPLLGADDGLRRSVGNERAALMTFYSAGLHAYKGEQADWGRAMQAVMEADGGNPYYQWYVQGGGP